MAVNPQQQQFWQGGPLSVEDYLHLDRSTPGAKYEYLDGVARLMSGGSVEHDRIARNVANSIERHFSSGPCTVFGSDVQVRIGMKADGKETYVYPDTSVSCDLFDRRRGNKLIRSPRIVVEVLSPSTERDDRGKKLMAYQACPTIQEIILISQFAPHVELYRRTGEDETTWSYIVFRPGEEIKLSSVDVSISMEEIYNHINFDEPLVED
jgi:Uma2 family endonuclease